MIDNLQEIIHEITAIFFVWFTTIFSIGIAVLMLVKVALLFFPELKGLTK